ncbi:uncharacterized protein LACBIDRAFT_329924 [Laccaria bicolor S238N-H82]|uniref:Predicted protein n=1 Tax=Laccaria bicolor (strain S238N-H82 / ATCC MYA-4686) TaxID=486041 RepID=B0DJM3_LACBS|nr:uncharacterized protein LACBIDRAFT_329924 [Laccaria bicolor S238N-H82]EDR05232.1 predicted protein [Laccaria bicolor S238N-H82]|eukprot:XP_001884197.1 predicted protein [Laccaria bicolor S238N-H82]
MRSLLAFFALAVSAGASALVFPAGKPACIAEYCAGNFPDVVQPPAPTPSVPSLLDALTNAERLVRGMPLKAPVRRRSDFVRRSTPSSVPVVQVVKTVTKRGVIEVKNSTGDCLGYTSKNSLSKAQLQFSFIYRELPTRNVRLLCHSWLARCISSRFVTAVAGAVPANIFNVYTNVTTLVRAAESDVWTIDLTTSNLNPQWINSNGYTLHHSKTLDFNHHDVVDNIAMFTTPALICYSRDLQEATPTESKLRIHELSGRTAHRKRDESTFIPRSTICSRKEHPERSKDLMSGNNRIEFSQCCAYKRTRGVREGLGVVTYAWTRFNGGCLSQDCPLPALSLSTRRSSTQSRARPPLLRLSDEILDDLASELDLHEDLINFALDMLVPTSSYPVIPNIEPPASATPASSYGRTSQDKLTSPAISARCIYANGTTTQRLIVFSWCWNTTGPQQRSKPTVLTDHGDAILDIVRQKPTLKHLGLSGCFANHVQSSNVDRTSMSYPLWNISNLTALCLLGDAWVKSGNAAHVSHMFELSPGLEYLEIPLEFHNLAKCRFPCLKKLKLSLQSGATSSIDESRARFLENHPTIEELTWFPIGIPNLAPGSLPILKRLRTSLQVVIALDQLSQDHVIPVEKLVDQVSPQRLTLPMPTPDPPVLCPLECLDVRSVDAQTLASFKTFDRMSLRRLRLHMLGDLHSIHQLAEFFPNITWLSLPAVHLPKDAIHPANEEWFSILSLFPNLEVFRGRGLWTAVDSKKEKMPTAIMQLVQLCPKLRELDHCDFYEKHFAWRRIAIIREGEFGERVRYEVRKPPAKGVFDVTDGAFD